MDDQYRTRATLLYRLRDAHDEKSWEEFVGLYQNYINAVVRNMKMNKNDQQDIVQEVLLKAWKTLPEFDYQQGKGRLRGWLATVTRNAVMNLLEKRNNRARLLNERTDEKLVGLSTLPELPEIERIAEEEWQVYVTNLALKTVREQFTEDVMAIFEALVAGETTSTVAEKYQLAQSSVKVYKMRVKKALFREISRLERELG